MPEIGKLYRHPDHPGWLVGYIKEIDLEGKHQLQDGSPLIGSVIVEPHTSSISFKKTTSWIIPLTPFIIYWVPIDDE